MNATASVCHRPCLAPAAVGADRARHFPALPNTHVETRHIGADRIGAEWIIGPGVENPQTIILFLHGGAYITGAPSHYRGFTSRLSVTADAQVCAVDYRLAPEHPFPAALDDAQAAYTHLLDHGHNPAHIIIIGDSAGGGLVLSLLTALRMSDQPLPCAAVVISPWTDLTFSGETHHTKAADDPWLTANGLREAADLFLNGADPTSPLISPLFADFAGWPPLLIMVGGREILLSDSTRLAERAAAKGVSVTLDIWHDMIHVFPIFAPLLPQADHAIERIGLFVRYHRGN